MVYSKADIESSHAWQWRHSVLFYWSTSRLFPPKVFVPYFVIKLLNYWKKTQASKYTSGIGKHINKQVFPKQVFQSENLLKSEKIFSWKMKKIWKSLSFKDFIEVWDYKKFSEDILVLVTFFLSLHFLNGTNRNLFWPSIMMSTASVVISRSSTRWCISEFFFEKRNFRRRKLNIFRRFDFVWPSTHI